MADIFRKENLRCRVPAEDWRSAVRAGGGILVQAGSVAECYVPLMLRVIEEYGPYMVIAPGLAVLHGPPGKGVLRTDMAFMTLDKPVCFGSENDPVSLLLILAAEDPRSHLAALEMAARVMAPSGIREQLAAARTEAEMDCLLNGEQTEMRCIL